VFLTPFYKVNNITGYYHSVKAKTDLRGSWDFVVLSDLARLGGCELTDITQAHIQNDGEF
jgi:hypothetical protein